MIKTSIVIITYNRKNDLRECIDSILNQSYVPDEIIIVDNNSTDGTENYFKSELKNPLVKYIRLDKNLGVAGGRNYGIKQASGDILVFIDDDSLIEPINAIEKIIKKFEENPEIGIIAFKIVNYHTKTIWREEFPHIDKSLNPEEEFETTYFIGAGHAIRREVFKKCGLYPDDYFYGMEELDLSFRVIDKGFKIVYFPKVLVWHKKSPLGRVTDEKKWIYTYRNRLAISYKYLNSLFFLVSSFIWFFKILKESKSLLVPIKGFFAFLEYKKTLIKQPISSISVIKIKKLRGRLWF